MRSSVNQGFRRAFGSTNIAIPENDAALETVTDCEPRAGQLRYVVNQDLAEHTSLSGLVETGCPFWLFCKRASKPSSLCKTLPSLLIV